VAGNTIAAVAKRSFSLLVLVALLSAAGCSIGSSTSASLGTAELHMVDSQNGWAYSRSRIARTSDGALTFQDVTAPGVTDATQLDPPFFLDARHAWTFVVQWKQSTLVSATLERTSDGGGTWKSTPMEPAVEGDLNFADATRGWMWSSRQVGNNTAVEETLWRTADGGQTWADVYRYTYRLPIQPNIQKGDCSFSAIAWSSSTHGTAGVSCPFDSMPSLKVTDDAGSTWHSLTLSRLAVEPGIALFSGVGPIHRFENGELATLVSRCVGSDGMSCRDYGQLYRSQDGGITWTRGALVWGAGDLVMSDPLHGWLPNACPTDACYGPQLLNTVDGGTSWQVLDTPTAFAPNMHGSRIYSLVTPTLGFVVVSNEFQPASSYFKTTDGGRTFQSFVPRLV
jgi:photosystem II stability/assembly factor-like uncharacterized protein